jgi:L-fuculose-phosphate aldolase
MADKDYRQLIVDAGKAMIGQGLTIETWGNLSLRDPASGLIYITPSGMAYDTLTPEDVVVLHPDGSTAEGIREPSVEKLLHSMIYQHRPDVNAVLHTHPEHSLVFAVLHRDIPVVTDELAQAVGGPVRCAAYALPGSQQLAENGVEALGSVQACLLANHGAVCVGKDMEECFRVAAVLEAGAEVYARACAIGTPVAENPADVAWMRDFAVNRYGKANRKEPEKQ